MKVFKFFLNLAAWSQLEATKLNCTNYLEDLEAKLQLWVCLNKKLDIKHRIYNFWEFLPGKGSLCQGSE